MHVLISKNYKYVIGHYVFETIFFVMRQTNACFNMMLIIYFMLHRRGRM